MAKSDSTPGSSIVYQKRASNFRDLTGSRFGKLVVVGFAGCASSGQSLWVVQCECGCTKTVRSTHLISGDTVSCGCWRSSGMHSSHGKTDSAEYISWCKMKSRCGNPRDISYPNYGDRGIRVCERWLHSFENFLADMGPKPSPKHELDRFPHKDGDYEPTNCRWATRVQQARHKRNNILLTLNGETLTLPEWSERTGISVKVLYARVYLGWSDERILTQRVKGSPGE